MPGLSQFDLLNDKWRFTRLCESLGLQFAHSVLFQTPDELNRYVSTTRFEGPRIAKPLSKDGGVGCIKFGPEDGAQKLAGIAYQPIIVQELVDGEDICASVFCRNGEIKAILAYLYKRATYVTFYDESIHFNLGKIVRRLNLDGVINFDMRRRPDGRIVYIECNPRFFFKIAMSMVAGMNFVAMGLPGHEFDGGPVCSPATSTRFAKAWPLTPPWRLKAGDWRAFRFLASDPIPLVWEQLGLADLR
jgi:carbamoylphosphate synthase large subunit